MHVPDGKDTYYLEITGAIKGLEAVSCINYPLGVYRDPDGVHIAVENRSGEKLSLLLFDLKDNLKKYEIPFDMEGCIGAVYFMTLKEIDVNRYAYLFQAGKREFMDPYAVRTVGNEKWGKNKCMGLFPRKSDYSPYRPFTVNSYVKRPKRPFSEMILYLMHVRGFTMHRSSGVKHPGTFEGIIEKIPYLTDLGINAVELLPPYDFNEVMPEEAVRSTSEWEASPEKAALQKKHRINYWGFTGGNYFTPKNSFSAPGDGPLSFSRLVESLHEAGIEVIIDFFFEYGTTAGFILKCLRHWLFSYSVDGFRILGHDLPYQSILKDPYLSDTKLLFEHIPEELPEESNSKKRMAFLNTAFMYDNRKFLKSDEDMLSAFTHHLIENPDSYSVVNFMTSYYGFNMCDMVSYDQKHNEANGEDNADGNNYNYSWNCGVEGKTRRKQIISLRLRQVRNAFSYLLLSQGVPEILSGDEFLHTQKGNNNAYCQDNPVTWLNWEELERNREIYSFVRSLIAFRKSHPVFHSEKAKRLTDYRSTGYPDLSFHGEQAWAARFDNFYRHIGVLYSGSYEKLKSGEDDSDFYVAFNMHWQGHRFALPNPPAGKRWKEVYTTESGFREEAAYIEGSSFFVEPRSIRVLETVPLPGEKRPSGKERGKKQKARRRSDS